MGWSTNSNGSCSSCKCSGTSTPCNPTVINVWDRMNPGSQAQGLMVEIYYSQQPSTYNPAYPWNVLYASGPPGTNFGVLPLNSTFSTIPNSYWPYPGYYQVVIRDTENDYPVPWSYNGQVLQAYRCNSLNLWFCKTTVDVDTEEDATVEMYAPNQGVGYVGWLPNNPHRQVLYSLAYAPNPLPTTPNDPMSPVYVVVSASKDGTLGNCKGLTLEGCNRRYTVSLPLFHYTDTFIKGNSFNNPSCEDKGCLVRGPGPVGAGVIAKVLHVTFTPYWFTDWDGGGCAPAHVPDPDNRSWWPDRSILGSDWGRTVTITYDPDLGGWDSGWLPGGNGRCVSCGTNSYGAPIYSPVTTTRFFISDGFNMPSPNTPPNIYQWKAEGCNQQVYGANVSGGGIPCHPSDSQTVYNFSGPGGQNLVWFTVTE